MENSLNIQSFIFIGTGIAVGAIGAYLLGKDKNKVRHGHHTGLGKSFSHKNPLLNYAMQHSLRYLPVQEKLKNITLKHSLSGMMGAPEICQLLQNLIRAINAKKAIEIGVFTGCLTLGFALALPKDGRVVACDVSDEYASIGKPYWKEAGIDHKIDLRIQSAIKTLDDLLKSGEAGTFDLVFIDADKEMYDTYYEKSLQLIRSGGIIALDNVLRSGTVLDENPTRPGTAEMKMLNKKLKNDDRIDISMLVIGDGLTLAFKK